MRKLFLILSFVLVFTVYFLTSKGHTPYDYFTRLSDAFLDGKYYLNQNPPWLNELVPDNGKYYVVYPAMPAITSVPFRFLFGEFFYQEYLAHLMGAGFAVFIMLISWNLKRNKLIMVWSGILGAFGNIIWYLASDGAVWYLGLTSGAFFLTGAIWAAVTKKSPVITGLFLGAAYLSRLPTILTLPFFLYFVYNKDWFRNYFKLALGLLPFLLFNFGYNFIRYGTIFDQGYYLIPGVLDEPWFQKGIFDLSYIPRHLKIIFASFPKFVSNFPYITPSWGGLSIWITTPAFVYAFLNKIKTRGILISWFSIFLVSLVIFSHGTTGFIQFGYRYAVDFYPLLFFLTIKHVAKTGLRWHHWVLLTISVLVNAWGVIWINIFDWVSF
jgi:hypothetical protein